MYKLMFYISAALLFIFSAESNAQFNNLRFGAGLSTIQIIGNNIATKPFVYDTDSGKLFGGSFDQAQSGIRIEVVDDLDKSGHFQLPLGMEYNFFRAREKQPLNRVSEIQMRHDQQIMALTLGFNWVWYQLEILESISKFYIGVDTRTSFIFQGTYEEDWFYQNLGTQEQIRIDTKQSTVRLGGTLNFGVNGDLLDPIAINFKAGVGVMNLFLRDDNRGELLTMKKEYSYTEDKETLVYTFNINLTLQYKL